MERVADREFYLISKSLRRHHKNRLNGKNSLLHCIGDETSNNKRTDKWINHKEQNRAIDLQIRDFSLFLSPSLQREGHLTCCGESF